MVLPEIRAKQHGIGLLELLLSLAIIAVLIVITARYFESVRFSQQAVVAHAQIMEIVQAANRYKAIHGTFEGASLDTVKLWLSDTMASKVTGKGNDASIPSPFGNGTVFQLWGPWMPGKLVADYILVRIYVPDDPVKCVKMSAAIPGTACANKNAVDMYYPEEPF